jgi:hypothetical protein
LVRSLLFHLGMEAERRATWRRRRTWLLTAAVVVVPFAGVLLAVYGVGRLVLSRRSPKTYDPYQEWLALRDLIRARRPHSNGVESSEAKSSPARRPS